ncbi:MAG: hypothetical protein RI897_3403 [Verrucomicrobiota bacterium]
MEGGGDPFGDHVTFGEAVFTDGAEEDDESGDGSYEAEEWGDADDDFEQDEAAFHEGDFVAGADFEGIDIFFAGQVPVGVGGFEESADGGGVGIAGLDELLDLLFVIGVIGGVFDVGGDDFTPAQGEAAFHDEGEADDGDDTEDDDEQQVQLHEWVGLSDWAGWAQQYFGLVRNRRRRSGLRGGLYR